MLLEYPQLHEQVGLPTGDVLVHTGDFSARGRLDEGSRFLAWFATVGSFRHRLLVAGNHDFAFERVPVLARALMPESVTYPQGSGVELGGLRFWGGLLTPAFEGGSLVVQKTTWNTSGRSFRRAWTCC